jgi:hypothetical protein
MTMWTLFDIVLFAAGYLASIYSWPTIRVWANGVTEETQRLRAKAERLEADFRDI